MTNREVIRSKDNARLAYARAARDGRSLDVIFNEGKRQCLEAARANVKIELCLFAEGFDDLEAIDKLRSSSVTCVVVADRLFDSIAETKSPQGVIAIARRPSGNAGLLAASLSRSSVPMIVFLREINNPSNLGAILRTAEAAGVAGVITSSGSADAFSPKANRAALGANLRIPIWEKADPTEVIQFAKENELLIAAAVVSDAVDYTSTDWQRPTMLMLGSEAHGLSDELAAFADIRVTIPLMNGVESLNLAVSCGVILFEVLRQNRLS
ncbi:MAG: RNA methyltransferase [Blastocatellia bacterium]|jgi:TrmH family RNA methyltransferase|nr:RNA methyltransferase [Blastocatellia bacterium]